MLADAVAVSRGDMFTPKDEPAHRADAFAAHLVWLSEAPLLPGRGYLLKAGAQTTNAAITELKYRLNVDTSEHLAAKDLHRDEIAFANIATADAISFDPYGENSETGGFILIDRHTDATVAAGLIRFALRRAANTHCQSFEVNQNGARAFETTRGRRSFGSRVCRARESRRSPIAWTGSCMRSANTPLCLTATTFATGSTAT
jgi:bifunctional enzyme CysN/CysC